MDRTLEKKIETAAKIIMDAERVVAFTGAGISTESGLPDYRGPDGVWTRRDKGLPPKPMKKPWSSVEPNRGHLALVALQKLGKLDHLISQNVDNLHLKSGIDPDTIAELHGNTTLMRCLECDRQFPKDEVGWDERRWGKGYRTQRPRRGQPTCPVCGGRIISSVVNFGDPLLAKELEESVAQSKRCDTMLVVGSSLLVSPANLMPEYALENGAKLILINKGETPFDTKAHVRIWESAGEVLSAILDRVRRKMCVGKKQ